MITKRLTLLLAAMLVMMVATAQTDTVVNRNYTHFLKLPPLKIDSFSLHSPKETIEKKTDEVPTSIMFSHKTETNANNHSTQYKFKYKPDWTKNAYNWQNERNRIVRKRMDGRKKILMPAPPR